MASVLAHTRQHVHNQCVRLVVVISEIILIWGNVTENDFHLRQRKLTKRFETILLSLTQSLTIKWYVREMTRSICYIYFSIGWRYIWFECDYIRNRIHMLWEIYICDVHKWIMREHNSDIWCWSWWFVLMTEILHIRPDWNGSLPHLSLPPLPLLPYTQTANTTLHIHLLYSHLCIKRTDCLITHSFEWWCWEQRMRKRRK